MSYKSQLYSYCLSSAAIDSTFAKNKKNIIFITDIKEILFTNYYENYLDKFFIKTKNIYFYNYKIIK